MHSFFQVTTRRKNRCYFNTNKEGAYIRGAYTRFYFFVYTRTPPPPPPPPLRLVYRDRPITGEAYKNVCVCVCVCWGGGGGGGGLQAQVYGICIETVKHSQFKEQRTET